MRVLPPVYFMLSIVGMAVVHLVVPIARLIPNPWNAAGAAPLLAGILLAVVANRLFHKHGTAVHPFAEPSTLVVEGPFRYTRNPMYLGMILALVGIAVLFGTLTPWLVIPAFAAVISRLFVRAEERALRETFGPDYLAYTQRVRRWI